MTGFIEPLEPRQLLSGGFTPAQVRRAYSFDQATFGSGVVQQPKKKHVRRAVPAASAPAPDGSGQTIAIVGAYHAPAIQHDLTVFDKRFKLPSTDAAGQSVLTVASPGGQAPPLDAGWAAENTFDVEWAHAIAPGAHVLLVEAASRSTADLLAAVDYARRQPGVSVVSMSWSFAELPSDPASNGIFTTPPGHAPVTFVAAAGDGAGTPSWPGASPNVLSVGGTSLKTSANGAWRAESAWSGGGGGRSAIEQRNSPDVAYAADPDRGFATYDSTPDGKYKGWQTLGGTSAGAPQWAALIAIADQGRTLQGKAPLDGVSQTKPAIYALPQEHFHDITTGSNGFPAAPGYDLATGRGSAIANLLIADLIAR